MDARFGTAENLSKLRDSALRLRIPSARATRSRLRFCMAFRKAGNWPRSPSSRIAWERWFRAKPEPRLHGQRKRRPGWFGDDDESLVRLGGGIVPGALRRWTAFPDQ